MSAQALPLAASVLLLREATAAGAPFELYMLRRPERARFAPGAYIFPGGVLDREDRAAVPCAFAPRSEPAIAALHARMDTGGQFASPDEETTAALLVCAVRELFEEAGVLLARTARGVPVGSTEPARRRAQREELLAGRLDFAALLDVERLRLAPDDLVYFSHWITPEASRIRFDTHFFLAVLPAGQAAAHYAGEMAGGLWLTPREGLARHARGDFPLMPVQQRHLERLAGFDSIAALLAFGRAKAVPAVLPVMNEQGREVALPEELAQCW